MATGASPSAVREPIANKANGSIWVFYKSTNGNLTETYELGGEWLTKELSGRMG
jgi:hypothetical protein